MCAPGNVVRSRGCTVLVYQLLDHLARVVQFVKVVLEYVLFAELLQEGLTLTQFVILPACPFEQLWDSNESDIKTKASAGKWISFRFLFIFLFLFCFCLLELSGET